MLQRLLRNTTAVTIALLTVVFAAHVWLYWDSFTDASYVAFRYAHNLAGGLGFVYNPDERVEGTTSVLWVLWLSLGVRLGLNVVLFAKLSGAAFGAATLGYTVLRLHWSLGLCLASSGIFAYWSAAGLETALFALVLCAAFGEFHRRNLWVSAVLFALLPYVRPEGYFLCLFFPLALLLSQKEWVLPIRRRAAAAGIVFVAPLLLEIWRRVYFGVYLPNALFTRIVKPSYWGFSTQVYDHGVSYVASFWKDHPILLALYVISFADAVRRRARLQLLAHAFLLAYQAYVAFVGGDGSELYGFYVVLLAPIFALIASIRLPARLTRWHVAVSTVVMAVLCVQLFYPAASRHLAGGTRNTQLKQQWLLGTLSQKLQRDDGFEQSILTGDLGLVGYASKLHVVDGTGTVDAYLSTMPRIQEWKSDHEYLLAANAEWVLIETDLARGSVPQEAITAFKQIVADQPNNLRFTEETWIPIANTGRFIYERDLLANTDFHARYGTVLVSPKFGSTQYLALFCRRDVCESAMVRNLQTWTPNLGVLKAELGRDDAVAYLSQTLAMLPHEDVAAVEFAILTGDAELLRSVGEDWRLARWSRMRAYTQLGLNEYEWKQYHSALKDFKAAIDVGGRSPANYDNVGWALKALNRPKEAEIWFKRGKAR